MVKSAILGDCGLDKTLDGPNAPKYCLYFGKRAGDGIKRGERNFVLGDGYLGNSDDTGVFHIGPVPSITEDPETARVFVQFYGNTVFLVKEFYTHLTDDQRSQALAALEEVNMKCCRLLFRELFASH